MMLTKTAFLIVLAGSGIHAAFAQTQCVPLANAMEFSQKRIAMIKYGEGFGDDSAPRATMRELQVNSELQIININLQLSIQAKCQAPEFPVDLGVAYMSAALECANARLGNRTASIRDIPEACKLANWKRK